MCFYDLYIKKPYVNAVWVRGYGKVSLLFGGMMNSCV